MSGRMSFSTTGYSNSSSRNNATMNSTDTGKQALDASGTCEIGVQNVSGQLRAQHMIDDRLQALVYKHEIRVSERDRLNVLAEYEIVVLCDDSGSMNLTVDGTKRTRWDELRNIVKFVIEIGTIFDTNGVDVYFLNRENTVGIMDPNDIDRLFIPPPTGYTPLVRKLQEILHFAETRPDKKKKVLVFIATDGAPTDDDGNPDLEEFEQVMRNERNAKTTHVMFLLCTDEPDYIDYLTKFKGTMRNVDVYDDYETEKKRIRRLRGDNHTFSRSDYIVQALVGAVEHKH